FFRHLVDSSNPMGYNRNTYQIPFHPYFTIKDVLIFIVILIILICRAPHYLSDPDANIIVTPIHIKLE
ncbi:Cytochrome b, partial [Habropoda laboriosa]